MNESNVSSLTLPEFPIWEKIKGKKIPISFELELSARCNCNCRHCYINLPPGDIEARNRELSLDEIKILADEAKNLGALWCLITGGEPLLREDFFEIYIYLKKKGFLITIFTNATLITQKHIDLFKKFPPRDIEVTVYGISKKTYEKVTRIPGSFYKFKKGLDLLLNNGIKIILKSMALRSNIYEMGKIHNFCKEHSNKPYRFDPFLHLRYDGDPLRNEEIRSERLSPQEIIDLERSDPERFEGLKKKCDTLIIPEPIQKESTPLFNCSLGSKNFVLGYNGFFRLCSSLNHPDCIYDLRKISLIDAWNKLLPEVRKKTTQNQEIKDKCQICRIKDLCMWCPAHVFLEIGILDGNVDYFCKVAHARENNVKNIDI